MDDQKLYHYRFDPSTGRMVVVDRDFDRIKQQMLFMLTNHAQPYIYVLDGNYRNRGELYLGQRHIGVDLDIKYAIETLKALQKIWRRPIGHARVLDGFRQMAAADPDRWITVQAIGTVDRVAEEIHAALVERRVL